MTDDLFQQEWTPIGSHGLQYLCSYQDDVRVTVYFRRVVSGYKYLMGSVHTTPSRLSISIFRSVYQREKFIERRMARQLDTYTSL